MIECTGEPRTRSRDIPAVQAARTHNGVPQQLEFVPTPDNSPGETRATRHVLSQIDELSWHIQGGMEYLKSCIAHSHFVLYTPGEILRDDKFIRLMTRVEH